MNERAISHRLTSLVLPIRASRPRRTKSPTHGAIRHDARNLFQVVLKFERGEEASYQDGNFGVGAISETHLLLSRPVIVTQIEVTQIGRTRLTTTIRSLRADATAGTGLTKKSTKTIPRHAQRLFLLDHQPAQYRNRLQQSPQPKRRLDGAGAREGRPNQNCQLRSSQPVRRTRPTAPDRATNES